MFDSKFSIHFTDHNAGLGGIHHKFQMVGIRVIAVNVFIMLSSHSPDTITAASNIT